jgi:4-hydroxybenzoate polyprenyltransferase
MAYLQLMRFPNLFTAAADVLAGYLIVCGLNITWWELGGLVFATMGIYAGGCAFNDFCDREVDARERPSRPIPSGKVSAFEAFLLSFICFGVGLLSAHWVGRKAFVIAIVLALLAISYDAFTKKKDTIGPLNMAACRSCNLVLGMSPALSFIAAVFILPLISFVYVFTLTSLSRYETETEAVRRSWMVLGGWLLVVVTISLLTAGRYLMIDGIIFLAILALYTGKPLVTGLLKPSPDSIQQAVKTLIIGIPLLDAVYSAGTHGFVYGIPVALCLLPPRIISRYFYVT